MGEGSQGGVHVDGACTGAVAVGADGEGMGCAVARFPVLQRRTRERGFWGRLSQQVGPHRDNSL
jgi:hypothetical protein